MTPPVIEKSIKQPKEISISIVKKDQIPPKVKKEFKLLDASIELHKILDEFEDFLKEFE